MIYDYIISLKNAESRTADIISQILYFIALVYFAVFAFYPAFNRIFLGAAVGIFLCWAWLTFKKRKGSRVYFTSGLALAALAWFTSRQPNWWFGILYVAAALAEREYKFAKEIGFATSGITVNSIIKKNYAWNEVKNAMIKEGILTIDLKNNKLIQAEIAEEVPLDTEAEFNSFCQAQLTQLNVGLHQ